MIKIRSLLAFVAIPLVAGYACASLQTLKPPRPVSSDFNTNAILQTDRITLIDQGNIVSLTHSGVHTIPTHNQQLIEASPLGDAYIAVDKQTNYSSLEEFTKTGKEEKILMNGNTGNIDTMSWVTDPTVNPKQQEIAFVSDIDKEETAILDNALFVENLKTNTRKRIAEPDPHSGGIAHPVWNPANPSLISYDYYQYNKDYNPYSVINTYDRQTGITTQLTSQKENAYQGSFSASGKRFIFLGRNTDNTVTMYLADIARAGLSGAHPIATGDFAYPTFSNTPNHLYFLQAQGNSGYDLYTAEVINNKLAHISAITAHAQLLANSGFSVSRLIVKP